MSVLSGVLFTVLVSYFILVGLYEYNHEVDTDIRGVFS